MTAYISNSVHYKEVLSRVQFVKQSLWIGTADIKDLYIEDGKSKKPFLEVLAKLIKKGVAGIQTDEPDIVEQAMNQFDEVWMGKHCKSCKRRDYCPDLIA